MVAKKSLLFAFIILVLSFSAVGVAPVYAATLIVTNTNDSGAGSLRQAIAAAGPGDTITFASGLSGATIRLASTLSLSKSVTIDGSSLASKITLSGDTEGNGTGDVQVFYIDDNIYNPTGVVVILDSLIISNGAAITNGIATTGGGIYKHFGTLTVRNSTFTNNSAVSGGAIYNQFGILTVTNSIFSGNSASTWSGSAGGGIANDQNGMLTVTDSTFINNTSSGGGGIFTFGTATITNSIFINNSASAAYPGGGIWNQGTLTVTNSSFTGNSNSGIGISTGDNVVVTNSTFSNNSHGIINYHSTLTLTNSTVSGNSGIGIDNVYGGTINLRNATIVNNHGGGVINASDTGTVNSANTIIAGNTGFDCLGLVTSQGHNLIQNTSNCTIGGTLTGNLVGVSPNLGPLENNGGPTFTHALLTNSPAINTGNDAICPSTDQRGIGRPQSGHCDIGAVEAYGASKPPLILVHGWQGFPPKVFGCTSEKYLPVSAEEAKGYFQDLGDRLKTDGGHSENEIFYARLVSNRCYTPPLEENVRHLMTAIDEAKAVTGQSKVILIAHSMGGLVARAYIEGSMYRGDVKALFTFGSPHLGSPEDGMTFLFNGLTLGNVCRDRQPAACDFTVFGMRLFNAKHRQNKTVTYHMISGDAPFFSRSPTGMAMEALILGPDDGIVPTDSGRAASLGTFDRWTTDEVHGEIFGTRSYFIRDGAASTSYSQCVKKVLIDGAANCGTVTAASTAETIPATLAQHTPVDSGTLQSGQTITYNISLEGGPALFTSQWQEGTLALTLIDPNGQTINPAFATANPSLVTYSEDADAATYYIPNAMAGTWQLVIQAVSIPAGGTSFTTFAAFDSNVTLTGQTDKQWYAPGATITVTAAIGGSQSSTTVTGTVLRADMVVDTLSFTPIGNGQYQATYTVPNVPGYAEVRMEATGTTSSSLLFERGTSLAFQISPDTFRLNNSYSDVPSPYPGSSLYQSLNVVVGINATINGKAGLSADLVDGSGQFVAHAVTLQDVPAGASTLTLQFRGSDIFASQRNGPYTLTNVLLTDETGSTLVTQEAQSVYTTAPYPYTDFATPSSFADVPTAYWASSFIERLYSAGVTGGCAVNPLSYCPEAVVTRAQMAVFLLRGIHTSSYAPPSIGAGSGFGDVPIDYWSGAWIKQLAAEGITTGCGNGNYCPEHPVTRAQMAVFLLRSKYGASYIPPAVGAGTGFGDIPSNYWAAAWIKQLVTEGITSGCGNGNYCPENPVTRAQMAVFLVRTFNLP